MADFRMKLFVLAGMATMFAGMASAQTLCTTATANAVFDRVESNDDQVSDTTMSCTSAGGTAAGTINMTVYMSPSVNITSFNVGTSSTPQSEAVAGLTGSFVPGVTKASGWVSGSVSGNSVTFSGIATVACPAGPACAAFTVTITNIKIQSSTVATGSGVPTGISETIFVSGTNTTPAAITTGSAVAYVTAGLAGVKTDKAFPNPLCNETTAWGSGNAGYGDILIPSQPAGNGGPGAAPVNFAVIFSEAFPNAFRIASTAAANGALGSWQGAHSETGTGVLTGAGFVATTANNSATSGTRVKIIFNNIPANVTLFVPITFGGAAALVNSAKANSAVLTLTSSETGALAAVAGSTANASPGATSDKTAGTGYAAPLTVTSGSATAIYEVTTISTAPGTFTIPVFLGAAAGAVPVPTTAITATVSFAPIAATSNVPNFVNGSSTATANGSTFTACSTTLLFPFVTNQLGFESGLAISNTGTDLLSVKSGAAVTSVTGQSGTCTLTFFGNATVSSNPPAFTTPAAVVPGTTWTNTLTAVVGGTPGNFGGYMFAQCNFLFAHGFTYIAYNLGQANGMAMGYVAFPVGTGFGANGLGRATPTTGAPEVLGN